MPLVLLRLGVLCVDPARARRVEREQRGVRARVRLLPAAVVDALALQALVLELLTHDAAVTADLCHVQRTEVAIVGVVDQHVVCGEVVGLWCVWRRGADARPVEAPLDDLDCLHRPRRCVASHRADEWGRGDTRWGQTTRTNEGLQGCARAPPQLLQLFLGFELFLEARQ